MHMLSAFQWYTSYQDMKKLIFCHFFYVRALNGFRMALSICTDLKVHLVKLEIEDLDDSKAAPKKVVHQYIAKKWVNHLKHLKSWVLWDHQQKALWNKAEGLQMISKLENNDRSLKQKFPMIYIILAYEKVFFVIFWCTSFKMPSLQYMCKALRESSLHENTVFSVCWRMGSAAYIIFIMQCGCQGEKSSNKKSVNL